LVRKVVLRKRDYPTRKILGRIFELILGLLFFIVIYPNGVIYPKYLKVIILMIMGRPGVVWLFTLGGVIWFFFILLAAIEILSTQTYGVLTLLDLIFSVIPHFILIVLFFMLKRSSLTWTYIFFGLQAMLALIELDWINIVISLVFAWIVSDYIKNKKIDGQALFK